MSWISISCKVRRKQQNVCDMEKFISWVLVLQRSQQLFNVKRKLVLSKNVHFNMDELGQNSFY